MARLPDFIVAGARKCGTTWLHRCLGEHPEIHLPTATKELFFFDRYWTRGPAWYAAYFRDCPRRMVCGDVSPSCFAHEAAPGRIARIVPRAKLIFILRDPVERAISAYRDMLGKGDTRLGLADALAAHPELVDEGHYPRHLASYRRHFAAGAIRVVIAEEVWEGGGSALSDTFDFLGVDENFRAPSFLKRIHQTLPVRSSRMAAAAIGASRLLHRAGLHRVVALVRASGAKNLILRRRPESFAAPSSVLTWLDQVYERDIENLSGMLHRDLRSFWPRRNAARHSA